MSKQQEFRDECAQEIVAQGRNAPLLRATSDWLRIANEARYSYHFSALGRPIIQYPQDMIAMQELIWQVRPDLIIETGIAHGGSLIMNASMLALLDYCDAQVSGEMLDPNKPRRRVLGVDIDIRQHNKTAIEAHPMANRIDMIEGSAIDPSVVAKVHDMSAGAECILVSLDSNHTHDHVLAELEAYAPLTSVGSYCVVFDTVIEDVPAGSFPDRPWDKGNNPKTAVWDYLKRHQEFQIDYEMDHKLLISVAPNGYLKRIAI